MGAPSKRDYESGERLRRLRLALQLEPRQMAALVGVTYKVWNNWECGYPVPRDGARRIKQNVDGVDLDWLIDGDEDYLAPALRKAIHGLPKGT